MVEGKTRIVVLGSGMAALSAVFRITSDPDWQARFEIDVLQQGWRCGGKCASGRDERQGERNFEHGLHVLGGFYHNTFEMLRECYDEWPKTGKSTIPLDLAFTPHRDFFLMQDGQHGWKKKYLKFPDVPGAPGVDPTEMSPLGMLERIRSMISDALRDAFGDDDALAEAEGHSLRKDVGLIDELMQQYAAEEDEGPIELVMGAYATFADTLAWFRSHDERSIGFRDLLVLAELVARVGIGFFADKIHLHGFDVIDEWDAIEWLERHGASSALTNSTFVKSGYDYAFAFVDGNPNQRNFAAGVALRGMLRMLSTYHESPFIHMNGGMGEIVIKPIYEVLVRRGVRFHFFHRVTAIHMRPGDTGIRSLEVSVQAELKAGVEAYDPLVERGDLRYWPAHPIWDQLEPQPAGADFESWWYVGPNETKESLIAGRDFDVVLSGIPIAALKLISTDFHKAIPGWSEFVAKQKTSPTMAVQYWFSRNTAALGNEDRLPLITGCVMPASTWCDMSFLLKYEQPIAGKVSLHLSYACGPFPRNPSQPDGPDDGFAASENLRAAAAEKNWNIYLREELLPDLQADGNGDFPGSLDPTVYARANVSPSELYALSARGSIASRPKVDGLGLDNFLVCGDWTRTGTNVGAVECAVTSGFQAARAISGAPQYIYGETDFP